MLQYRLICDIVFPMKEILLVRFEKPQRAFIRKVAKKRKTSEAQVVRNAVELIRLSSKLESQKSKVPLK